MVEPLVTASSQADSGGSIPLTRSTLFCSDVRRYGRPHCQPVDHPDRPAAAEATRL